MCIPIAVAGLIISAVGTVASVAAQQQQAKQQANALNAEHAQQQNDLNRQQDQYDQQARQAMNEQARQAMHDMALFDTVTGEYGGGNSADRAATIATVQNGEALATIAGNRDKAQMENRFQSLATTARTNSMLASIRQPSWIESGLRLGSAYMDYKTQTAPK
jgi:hypothetical protein